MCKFHVSKEDSIRILRSAHDEHTCDCCPSFSDLVFPDKAKSFEQLEGVYSVYNHSFRKIVRTLKCDYVESDKFSWTIKGCLVSLLSNLTAKDFSNNLIPKDLFDNLKQKIKGIQEMYPDMPGNFDLIKKSSPKISNLIMSILKHAGCEDYQNHQLIKDFNDRGTPKMDGFTLVLTTEPHRVVGMSAFGEFTSCQDWIEKDEDAECHHYTHMSWANALDATVGIMYIKRDDAESPSEDDTDIQDMLARALVRVAELPNGLNVVFIHKIYAHSPYDKYLRDSMEEWKDTLPNNFKVIFMYEESRHLHTTGVNKYGKEYEGFKFFTPYNKECVVYAAEKSECDCCEGSGEVECTDCSGRGYFHDEITCEDCGGGGCDNCSYRGYYDDDIECGECNGQGMVECNSCDGCGTFYEDDASYYPYNDHQDWLDLDGLGTAFRIPKYLWNWDVKPVEEEAKPATDEPDTKFKVGDKVCLRDDLVVGQRYGGLVFHSGMAECKGKIFEITSETRTSCLTYSLAYYFDFYFSEEMLQLANNVVEGVA